MSMLDRLSDWIAKRQEEQLVRKAGGTELTGNGVSLAAFMEAFDMPEDTRARMEAMAENYGLPRTVLDTETGRAVMMARACGDCRNRARCGHWLEGHAPGTSPDEFCPNSDRWSELVRTYPVQIRNTQGDAIKNRGELT